MFSKDAFIDAIAHRFEMHGILGTPPQVKSVFINTVDPEEVGLDDMPVVYFGYPATDLLEPSGSRYRYATAVPVTTLINPDKEGLIKRSAQMEVLMSRITRELRATPPQAQAVSPIAIEFLEKIRGKIKEKIPGESATAIDEVINEEIKIIKELQIHKNQRDNVTFSSDVGNLIIVQDDSKTALKDGDYYILTVQSGLADVATSVNITGISGSTIPLNDADGNQVSGSDLEVGEVINITYNQASNFFTLKKLDVITIPFEGITLRQVELARAYPENNQLTKYQRLDFAIAFDYEV